MMASRAVSISRRCLMKSSSRLAGQFMNYRMSLISQQSRTMLHLSNISSPLLKSPTLDQISHRRWQTSYPSHEVVGMPSLSPTMEAGTIASWNLEEGQSFAAGDILCEVETDKATVSFEAQDEGVVAKILADAGPNEIQCGEPILITVEDESDVGAFKDYIIDTISSTDGDEGSVTKVEQTITPELVTSTPTTVQNYPTSSTPPDNDKFYDEHNTSRKVIASPLAWTVAKEKGIDLSSIAIVGTGPEGRVIADDVREYIPVAHTDVPTTIPAPTPVTTIPPSIHHELYSDHPISPSAMNIANLLANSKQTIPHYYLTVDVALDDLLKLRSTLNTLSSFDEDAHGLTLNDLFIKAAGCAMKACPSANASWEGDSVRQYNSVDVNFVMGNGNDLYAPVLRGVDSRGVKSISEDISSALQKVEEGSIVESDGNDEFSETGTFTMMNLGMYGVKSCAPIIRAPQAVALALGAAENRVVPKESPTDDNDLYDTRVILTATLSCDHRVVDGAVGAQWLSAFKAAVEHPEMLIL